MLIEDPSVSLVPAGIVGNNVDDLWVIRVIIPNRPLANMENVR